MKTTNCVYRVNPVPLGRARSRCPACGAELQSTDPAGHHYIAPRRIDRGAPGKRVGAHETDPHPPEPEHP